MYGIWCLLSLIILAGILGGFIYTLNSTTTHKFRLPFQNNDIDAGFFGHIIIGVGGAFVAIAAAVALLDLDLSIYTNTWSSDKPPKDIIPSVLYVIAVGIIGGFSGLRIISGLSDAVVKKLQQDFEIAKRDVADLSTKLAQNYQEDKKREQTLKEEHYKNILLEGKFLINAANPHDGISKIEQYLEAPDADNSKNHKAWSWLAMGYKRIGNIDKAIEIADIALSYKPDNWLYHYNKACYLALSNKDPKGTYQSLKSALSYSRDQESYQELKQLLTEDPDFENIRENDEFMQLIDF